MAQNKTPGVNIVERDAFPNSVVEVATSVPAFLGYTEIAKAGDKDLAGTPFRIASLSEFKSYFGGAPKRVFKRVTAAGGAVAYISAGQDFYLFHALRLYFNNGGGPCYIVSVGFYGAVNHAASDFSDAAWKALAKQQEPSIYLAPDAVALSKTDYKAISERMLLECQTLGDRVAILDVYDGADSRIDEAIDGSEGFRNYLTFFNKPSYGVAYYPWLNTTIVEAGDVTFTCLDDGSRSALADEIMQKDAPHVSESSKARFAIAVARIKVKPESDADETLTHTALRAASAVYGQAMDGLLAAQNVLPPSAAMAGVYARNDTTFGVFKAPANTGVVSVLSPTVTISDAMQEDLNAPLDGRAVNVIRSFAGRGVLVWGARTLDGNSQDFRYISVRRTIIMLEQSIFYAVQAYVFEPNVAATWTIVRSTIENFLINQWKAGALIGATPTDAFYVKVGLGATMTGADILAGDMRVTVGVALVRPAEFIVIALTQKMQTAL